MNAFDDFTVAQDACIYVVIYIPTILKRIQYNLNIIRRLMDDEIHKNIQMVNVIRNLLVVVECGNGSILRVYFERF